MQNKKSSVEFPQPSFSGAAGNRIRVHKCSSASFYDHVLRFDLISDTAHEGVAVSETSRFDSRPLRPTTTVCWIKPDADDTTIRRRRIISRRGVSPGTAYAAIRRGATFLFAINFLSGFYESTTQASDRHFANTTPCRSQSAPIGLGFSITKQFAGVTDAGAKQTALRSILQTS